MGDRWYEGHKKGTSTMSEPVIDVSKVEEPEHSPMGGSKAACFIACPGSVSLGQGLPDPESEYSKEGTLAHKVAADCLKSGGDAWTQIGNHPDGEVNQEMVNAVQVYLDDVRKWDEQEGESWIEEGFDIPEVHKHFRGTLDYAKLVKGNSEHHLRLWDYKHGVGILVEVEDNAQLKYYGVGLMLKIKKEMGIEVGKVFFTIVQPRAFHSDGPIRQVVYTADELFGWAQDTLLPAMVKAETSTETVAGDHCRFCPVRFRKCPALEKNLEEVGIQTYFEDTGDLAKVESLSNERIAHYLDLVDKVKIVSKAMQTLAFQRLKAGQKVPGRKLVNGVSNRVWKEGAEDALERKFKEQAYEKRKLLSPAQIEKLPEGKSLAEEYAFKPPGKLTMVPESDSRTAINTDTKSLFKPVKEKI